MESVYKLSVLLNVVDNMTGQLNGIQGNVSGSVQKMNSAFGTMQKAGAVMAGVGGAILGVGTKLVTSTFETQNALGELSSLGVKDLKAVENAAKSFSDTWAGTSKADFITASYDIKSGIASLTDEGVAKFTELAALTGKATKSTTEEMGSLFATGYGIYKGAYDDLSDIEFGEMFSAGIATAVKNYKTSGSEMASAISALGATATNNNVSLEEQLAIIGQLQTTMSGSEAATKYKSFLNQAASAGEKLGLKFTDTNNQLLSTPDILEQLKTKYGDTIDAVEKQELKEAFGTDEAVAMIDLLYNNVDTLKTGVDDLAGSMKNGTAVTEEMAEAINNTPEQKFQVLKQQIHNNMEELGSGLLPVVNDTMDKISDLISKGSEWISNNQETVQSIMNIAMKLGAFLLIAGSVLGIVGMLGKSMIAVKSVISGMKTAMSGMSVIFKAAPILLVVVAIITLIALFKKCGGDAAQLGGMISGALEKAGEILTGLVSSFLDKLPEFLEFGMQVIGSVIEGIADGLPQLITTGISLIQSLISGITQMLPELLNKFIPLISQAVTMLLDGLPNIINAGIILVESLIDGITQTLPVLIDAAINLITSLLQGIIQSIPSIINAGMNLIQALVTGITQMLPMLINAGLTLVMGLLNGILQNLPTLITTGISLIQTLLSGILQAIPQILQVAIQMVPVIIGGLTQGIPTLISGGISLILALINGMVTAIPELLGMIPEIMQSIIEGIMSVDWLSVGWDLIKAIFTGLWEGAKSLVGGIWNSIKGLFSDDDSGDGIPTESLASGIEKGTPALQRAASTAANGLENALSVDMAPLGSDLMSDIANGLNTGSPGAEASAQSAANGLTNALKVDTGVPKQLGSDLIGGVTNGIDTGASGAQTTARNAMNGIENALQFSSNGNAGVDLMGNVSNGITSGSASAVSATAQAGTEIVKSFESETANAEQLGIEFMNKVTSGLSTEANAAITVALNTANSIKSAFENMTITIPSPKIPKINVSYSKVGEGEAGAMVPSFSVSYHAKGGIMKRPTIFNAMIGGEAGDEALLPLTELWKQMKGVVGSVVRGENEESFSNVQQAGASITSTLTSKVSSVKKEKGTTATTSKEMATRERWGKDSGMNINTIHFTVDISKIKDLPLLYKLIDELKDAQNRTDVPVTA